MGYSMTVKGEMMLENGKTMPSVDAWLREAKADASAAGYGRQGPQAPRHRRR